MSAASAATTAGAALASAAPKLADTLRILNIANVHSQSFQLPDHITNTMSVAARRSVIGAVQYAPPIGQKMLMGNPSPLTAVEHRKQVLKLYKKIVRSAPRVLMAYEITGDEHLERDAIRNIRSHFERNRHVSDPGVVAVLRHKTEMEVTESLLMWKTKSHVCNLMLNDPSPSLAKQMTQQLQEKNLPKEAVQSKFLASFFQG